MEGKMRIPSPVVLALLFAFAASMVPALARADTSLSAEMKFSRSLNKRRPVDAGTIFNPGRVYAWTLIKGGKGRFTVNHLWYRNGKQVWSHAIKVRGKHYPTWSFLHVRTGRYKVELTDDQGTVITSGKFTIR